MFSLSAWLLAAIVWVGTSAVATAKEVIIDVRTPQEFAQRNIEGAINIDYTVIEKEIARAGVNKDDTVILYCRSGRRSGIAMEALQKMGYSKAMNYGGVDEALKRLGRQR